GSRQIGTSDLYLSRRLDRPPKERLRLPVGARNGPDRRQAPVARGDAAFGFRARADLRPVARDEVTTYSAIEIEERPYGGRAKRLGFGLDSFHADERARFVQHRDDAGEHAPGKRLDRHAARHFAIDLDDVRLQPPDAVEVGVPSAEIVDHDEAADRAVVLDRSDQEFLVVERRLDQFHSDPVRRQPVFPEHLGERAESKALYSDVRIDVQEEPAVLIAEA